MNAPIEAALLTTPTDHAGVALPTIVRLSQLAPSHTNPRRTFRTESLQEMALSIARHGVIQPILVRPWPAAMPKPSANIRFEIVAGERRYRASMLAGVETIPATVRSLSDTETLEIQILENLQREEVHPLEEAEGYQVLMLRTNYSVDQLAEKVGKSKAYIYARLKLCAITGEAREAFMAGTLSASVALLIARIPVPALQHKATKDVLNVGGWQGPMSARLAAEHIQRNYMLDLKEAPFSAKDAKLLDGVPSCKLCPKRTGNAPELFADVKNADVCTDPECYDLKRHAQKDRQSAEATARGQRIITGKEAERIAPYGVQEYSSGLQAGFAGLDQFAYAAPADGKGKPLTWRKLLGPDYQAPAVVEDNRRGVLAEIAPVADLIAAAKAKGIEIEVDRGSTDSATDREREKTAKKETAFRRALLERILFAASGDPLKSDDLVDLASAAYSRLHFDTQKLLCSIWTGVDKVGRDNTDALAAGIATMDAADVRGFLRMLSLVSMVQVSTWTADPEQTPERLLAAAERWGVDADVVRRQLAGPPQTKKKDPSREIQYRDVVSGCTWTGRGKKPSWVEARLAEGKTLDDLKVVHA